MEFEHKTLFLDIETTGLPIKMVPAKKPGAMKKQQLDYKTEYMEFPYIVEMAWAINDEEPTHYIINQEGREIPKEASDINGITTEITNKSEDKFCDIIPGLILVGYDCEIVVGHGLYFDTSTIKANILRDIQLGSNLIGFEQATETLHKHKRIDTMRSAIKMCRKWPTLSELHMKIFRKGFEAHNNVEDLEATRRCCKWMKAKGIVPTWEKLQEKKVAEVRGAIAYEAMHHQKKESWE